MRRIAIIEDDPDQSFIIAQWLKSYGYQCEAFNSAEAFLESPLRLSDFVLILLDWQLPGLSGLELLKKIVHQAPPILFITSSGRDEQLAEALHSGADDFLIKPVSKTVLLARIHAVTRRHQQPLNRLEISDKSLQIGSQSVPLSKKEFLLMEALYQNLGKAIPRSDLIETIWGAEPDNTRSLDVLVSRVRKKIVQADLNELLEIQNLYGTGYKLQIH
ncbi:response regulator transcription factor [Oceanospirillum sanctuarii]|uniref:response regulator transcription factor n=1 Tax=Oceanospirillum sanctuarii TaxID=1434821 RepID=UPI001123C26A|nr:response regulator transcription factor [Oceanospirillum sanctuarii]